jgi:hypothetical protein
LVAQLVEILLATDKRVRAGKRLNEETGSRLALVTVLQAVGSKTVLAIVLLEVGNKPESATAVREAETPEAETPEAEILAPVARALE